MSPLAGKLNLLVVVAGLGIGGAEVIIQHLVRTLDRQKFKTTIACIKTIGAIGEALIAEGFDVVSLGNPANPKHGYTDFLKLYQLIRSRHIDIVHSHSTDAFFDSAVCRLLRPRLKLVHTFHFGNYPHRNARSMWLERQGAKFATLLIAVGEVQRGQIVRAFGFRPGRVRLVRNGVAPAPRHDGVEFRRRIGAMEKLIIGVTATMIEQKGLFDFLDVASRFHHRSDELRFVVVGDGALRPQLEARRRALGLEKLVEFVGWIPHAREKALPAFDVFFQPSLWEAMSIALLEAMAAARPVVVSNVGEAVHIVDDGVTGLLVKPRDVEGMVLALCRLIDNPELRHRMGRLASQKVASTFSVDAMARSYEAIYAEASQGSPSNR